LREYMRAAKGKDLTEQAKGVAKKFIKDAPSSFSPSITRQIGRGIDPNVRDLRPEDRSGLKGAMKEGLTRAVVQTAPGLSTIYPQRLSPMTGEPRKTAQGEMGVAGRLLNFVSPVTVNSFKDDPLANEIIRLNDKLESRDINLYVPPLSSRETKVQGYKEPTSLLRQREGQFARTFSEKARQLIDSPTYQRMDDDKRADAFRNLISTIRGTTYKTNQQVSPARSLQQAERSGERAKRTRAGRLQPQYQPD